MYFYTNQQWFFSDTIGIGIEPLVFFYNVTCHVRSLKHKILKKKNLREINSKMNVCTLSVRRFGTTTVFLKKKLKSDTTLVSLKSVVSDSRMQGRRHRLGDKLETLAFDPIVRKEVLFREDKKVKTFGSTKYLKWWHFPELVFNSFLLTIIFLPDYHFLF